MSKRSSSPPAKGECREAARGLVPKLRFPEFQDGGEWEKKTLGNICDYWNGASHEGSVTEEGDYYLISLNSIDIDGNLKSDMKKLSNTDNSLQKNDMVMVLSDVAHGNFLGLTDIIPSDKFVLNQRMAGLRLKDENSGSVAFLRALINKNQNYFKRNGQGSSQLNLAKSAVTDFPVLFPSPIEQQKIADCLSSIDDLITAQSQKVEALKIHKKGLMQQLFPREGETVPRLRFAEFRDAGEWESQSIGDCAKVTTGNKDTQNKIDDGKYPFFVRSQNIERINSYSYDGEAILTSGDGVGVGKNFHYINGKFDFNQRVYCIYEFGKNISGAFIFHYFSEHFYGRVMQLTAKNSVDSVRMAMITDMPIRIPSIKEQRKVADCLSNFDDLITAQSQKLESLKSHKKGLMQQLFPTASEV